MALNSYTRAMLLHETRSLAARLAMVKPFALQETMLPAAALLPMAQVGDRPLSGDRAPPTAAAAAPVPALAAAARQRSRNSRKKRSAVSPCCACRFNVVLTQFDMFSDVITQRSENETGVWLSGLDVVAADALELPGYYEPPPVICYLDRDVGAAIRRARTRLPGGGENPVAIVRVPRERMVGTGIASSLVHEVGHQAAALLDLVDSLRPVLHGLQRGAGREPQAWELWERWISEIVADFWSVARVGIASTHRPDRRGEPAASLRLPSQRRRSASDAVDPRQAQRRDRRGALSASAMAAPERDCGKSYLPSRRIAGADARRCSRTAGEHAGLRRAAGQSPPQGVARPFADGSDGYRTAAAGAARRAVPAVGRDAFGHVPRVPGAGLCRDGPGTRRRGISPEDESALLSQAAHLLGAARHAEHVGTLCSNTGGPQARRNDHTRRMTWRLRNLRLTLTLDHYVIVQPALEVTVTVTLSRTLEELKAEGIELDLCRR